MNQGLFNFFGLIFALAGAITLAYGLIIPSKHALQIGVPRMAAEGDEQNLRLPQVRDRMRESRFALIGIVIMALGFLLQIIGHWPEF
ncbi:MAG TPA: hypothetical protein VLR90_04530 [Blastocatellia bacterium]|nr:hypothetical protein [Blastocatellia bacterium]